MSRIYVPDDEESYNQSQGRQGAKYGSKSAAYLAATGAEQHANSHLVERKSLTQLTRVMSNPLASGDVTALDAPRKRRRSGEGLTSERPRQNPRYSRSISRSRSLSHRSHSPSRRSRSLSHHPHPTLSPSRDLQRQIAGPSQPRSTRAEPESSPEHKGTSEPENTELFKGYGNPGKLPRQYDEHLDELDELGLANQASITSIKRQLADFKAVIGDMPVLKKDMVEIKKLLNEVHELRTTINTLVELIMSGAASDPNSLVNIAALKGLLDGTTSTRTLLAAPPESKPLESEKKKRISKVAKVEAELQPPYGQTKRGFVKHALKSLYNMMNISKSSEVRPSIKQEDGTYQFWVANEDGKLELRPTFESGSLGVNADPATGWVDEFITYCQDERHMDVNKDFLQTVPPHWWTHVLTYITFPNIASTAKSAAKGTLAEKTVRSLARGRDTARTEKKAAERAKARADTLVSGEEFRFLENPNAQSPEHSDADNSNLVCIDELSWQSAEYISLKDSLERRATRMNGGKVSHATKTQVVYFKTDAPIPNLGNDKAHPGWTVSKAWRAKYPEEYEESRYLIDATWAQPPNFSQLLEKYPPKKRVYVDRRPKPARSVAGRSISPPRAGSVRPLPVDQAYMPLPPAPQQYVQTGVHFPAGYGSTGGYGDQETVRAKLVVAGYGEGLRAPARERNELNIDPRLLTGLNNPYETHAQGFQSTPSFVTNQHPPQHWPVQEQTHLYASSYPSRQYYSYPPQQTQPPPQPLVAPSNLRIHSHTVESQPITPAVPPLSLHHTQPIAQPASIPIVQPDPPLNTHIPGLFHNTALPNISLRAKESSPQEIRHTDEPLVSTTLVQEPMRSHQHNPECSVPEPMLSTTAAKATSAASVTWELGDSPTASFKPLPKLKVAAKTRPIGIRKSKRTKRNMGGVVEAELTSTGVEEESRQFAESSKRVGSRRRTGGRKG
ncbi:hypothetical protein BDV93DRAFT_561373 [Ceratobasidium sp. AG-I]|nr:hypothetical protein BDV93DRAFT_561373 [Ceratobasidium sp. AG-I]